MSKSSPYLVPFDGKFRITDFATKPPKEATTGKKAKKALKELRKELYELQRTIYADGRHAVLAVFQAMDAGGKDSTIRNVFRGVNPAGCIVHSFKKPSVKELSHDFLWRAQIAAPPRGHIGVFNRSHYEETLVVRVHPDLLEHQKLPTQQINEEFWNKRFAAIRDWESHLAASGTTILKFFLNVSREAQAKRFLDRIQEPESNWKFNPADIDERKNWDTYMRAYELTLKATSRENAPWFAIPADDKPYMRLTVAKIVRDAILALPLKYPEADAEAVKVMRSVEKQLIDELGQSNTSQG